jgi:hypothetical protein
MNTEHCKHIMGRTIGKTELQSDRELWLSVGFKGLGLGSDDTLLDTTSRNVS